MRKLLQLILIGITAISCERDDPWLREWPAGTLTDGFCIAFGDSILLNHEEIEYYDISSHMIYLKEPLGLLEEQDISDVANMPFTVYAQKKPAYTGSLWPSWHSSIPSGPFIWWPSFYPAYVIHIEYPSIFFTTVPDTLSDPRYTQQVLDALEEYGQYRQGLSVSLEKLEVSSSGTVSFSYSVTNKDEVNYYVLSPDKMGSGTFHYFTNGLSLHNQEAGWLMNHEEVISPDPWKSWDQDWMDLLKGHSTLHYTIVYDQFDEIPPGEYNTFFRFPGLSHVDQDDIDLSQGRIWLGEIENSSVITVN